jgi:very-short-patch-repair endonuclease
VHKESSIFKQNPYRQGSVWHKEFKRQQRDALRANPTPAEKILLEMLESDERTKGQWVHQPICLGFIPDFGHEKAQIIVELDGEVHKQTANSRQDAIRDSVFRRKGFCVLRFTNAQLACHPREVFEKIVAVQYARLSDQGQ